MPNKEFGGYKSSTLMRALCLLGIGFQVTLLLVLKKVTIIPILFLAVYGFGLYATKGSKTFDQRQMQVLAGVSAILGLGRVFFNFDSIGGSSATGIAFVGLNNITTLDIYQLVVAGGISFFAYTLSTK